MEKVVGPTHARERIGSRKVPVLDKAGSRLGEVSVLATSTGASKVAGGPVEYSLRFGIHAWVRK